MKPGLQLAGIATAFLLGAVFGGSVLYAQDISYDRELWPVENAQIAAAMAGDTERQAMYWHPDMLTWPAGEDRPWDVEYGRKASGDWYGSRDGELHDQFLEPLGAKVLDNVGVTHYRLEFTVSTEDGEQETRLLRVTHFWLKTGDGWKIFGGANSLEE